MSCSIIQPASLNFDYVCCFDLVESAKAFEELHWKKMVHHSSYYFCGHFNIYNLLSNNDIYNFIYIGYTTLSQLNDTTAVQKW